MQSYFLSKETAPRAIEMAMPAITGMLSSGKTERAHLHVVIMDPVSQASQGCRFEQAILLEHSIGRPEWQNDYARIARSKAEITWRTGLQSQLVQQRFPYLLVRGDTRHAGAELRDGIVVACSGVEWYWDQLFSAWIAAACQAVCLSAMQQVIRANGPDYLGQE